MDELGRVCMDELIQEFEGFLTMFWRRGVYLALFHELQAFSL